MKELQRFVVWRHVVTSHFIVICKLLHALSVNNKCNNNCNNNASLFLQLETAWVDLFKCPKFFRNLHEGKIIIMF